MNTDIAHPEIRELDNRAGDGFEVTLFWNSRTGRVFVAVEDARTGDGFRVAVDAPDALDAFHHPYAYSRRRDRPVTSRPEWDAAIVRDEG